MEPIGDGPSIMADFLSAHGDGIHHVAFDCDAIPVSKRKEEFSRRGFELVQEGIWHGKKGTCHFSFFDTEGATTTCFESYDFSTEWEDPEDTIWYPHPPSAGAITAPAQIPPSVAPPARLVSLNPGAKGVLRAGHGASACIAKGQSLKIINTGGRQVVDFFAFALPPDFQPVAAPSLGYLSMNHTRTRNLHRDPRVGDMLCSNLRQPLLYFAEDTSPGLHDSLIPACDPERYRQLGVQADHRSCAENLKIALSEAGVLEDLFPAMDVLTLPPAPLNLFMNVSVAESGDLKFLPGKGKGGDFVVFRAEVNCLIVLSACPMEKELSPINEASDCMFEVL